MKLKSTGMQVAIGAIPGNMGAGDEGRRGLKTSDAGEVRGADGVVAFTD